MKKYLLIGLLTIVSTNAKATEPNEVKITLLSSSLNHGTGFNTTTLYVTGLDTNTIAVTNGEPFHIYVLQENMVSLTNNETWTNIFGWYALTNDITLIRSCRSPNAFYRVKQEQ